MKLLYLLLVLLVVSCTHKAAKKDEITGMGPEIVSIDTIVQDTSSVALVEIKGEVGVPDIESLQIRISNKDKENIVVCYGYSISALESGGKKLLLGKKLDAPVSIPVGEERVMKINLELDKVHYSKDTEYKLGVFCRSGNVEKGTLFESVFLFRTPEMWKEGKSITLMPDTLIDHCR